uniref:Uncharacterized protein n=1 Tax=Arundo donax TaxID=35708 RepID=A0A0A9B8C6_ARUDO
MIELLCHFAEIQLYLRMLIFCGYTII